MAQLASLSKCICANYFENHVSCSSTHGFLYLALLLVSSSKRQETSTLNRVHLTVFLL